MKKIISILLLTTFTLMSCWKKEEVVTNTDQSAVKYVSASEMSPKYFSEELKVSWKVASSKETMISPLTNWTIKTINYKVWDNVKAWDILATIDTQSNLANITLNNASNNYSNTLWIYDNTIESLKSDIETSKLQYENAKSTKENTYKTTEKQLALAQAQLDSVLKQKQNTSSTVDTTLKLSQDTVDNAQLNLDNFEKNASESLKSLDTKKKTIVDKKAWVVDTLRSTIDTAFVTINSSLTDIDKILWVTELNKKYNDNYEIYLSAKNQDLKNKAEAKFATSNDDFNKLRSTYSKDLSDEEIVKYYQKLLTISDEMIDLYDKMTDVLDNSVTSDTFTETTLSWIRATIKTSQNYVLTLKSNLVSLNNSLTDIDNSLVDIDNTISSTKTNLDTQRATLNQALNISKATLSNTKSTTTTNIDSINSTESTTRIQLESTIENINSSRTSVDNALKIAEQQYNSAKLKYNSSILSTKSQLDSAKWSKDSASQQVNNAQIRAPFDGIITSKSVEIWTAVSSQTQAFWIANNLDKIVKLELSSDNIKYMTVWKDVLVEKNWKTSTWIISMVSSSAESSTKMYKVEVMFSNQDFSKELVLWDYVDVFIKKEHNENKYLIVPFSSLIAWTNWNYSVYVVWSGSLVEEKNVKIWDSNSHEVIIVDWLSEKDKVITSWSLNVQVWDKVELK